MPYTSRRKEAVLTIDGQTVNKHEVPHELIAQPDEKSEEELAEERLRIERYEAVVRKIEEARILAGEQEEDEKPETPRKQKKVVHKAARLSGADRRKVIVDKELLELKRQEEEEHRKTRMQEMIAITLKKQEEIARNREVKVAAVPIKIDGRSNPLPKRKIVKLREPVPFRDREVVELDMQHVMNYARLGCSMAEIASLMDVNLDTILYKCRDAVERGRAMLKMSLRRKQYELAMSGHPGMLIWLGKNYLEQSDHVQFDVQAIGAEVQKASDADLLRIMGYDAKNEVIEAEVEEA